jgi:LPXTG-site transpeptidase (sortase) family protein
VKSTVRKVFTSKIGLVVVFLIVIIVAVTISLSRNDSPQKAQNYPETVTKSTDNPSEEPIDDYVWKGSKSDPKKISLPTMGVEGYIQKVGTDQRNEVGVPSNIHLAGWFNKSSLPGKQGLSIIDGHVDGISKPGIFKELGSLSNGKTFTIEFGDGSKTTFRVTGKTKINQEDAPSVLFSQDPTVKSQLNLITCGGTYDRAHRHYLDRIIITSVPV